MSKTDIDKIRDALNEMKLEPTCKINKNSVAKRAGVNHAVLYKKYEAAMQLRKDVDKAEEKRTEELRQASLEAENIKLKKQVVDLKATKKTVTTKKNDDGEWMAKLVEMYSMNDKMKETNSDLNNLVAHHSGTEILHFNEETGEVIEGVFDKKKT